MPTRPAGPCSIPNCPRLAVGRGRCRAHPLPPHTHDRSATARGYGAQWQRTVARAIRDQPFCSVCFTGGSPTNPLTGDHIVPLSKGGSGDSANVRILCRSCNSRKGAR